ncbi:hypothetical protein NRB56_08460 [Nocardia sp. RB56]|uniref:HTH araC/xylS-type domain-containing protein n=1 Tax=Nocardia aurantia TaxID=2585199 RepID=A0A7K0DHK3_9NOCA|nr:hypothetical protein [Nocardia aurantia]
MRGVPGALVWRRRVSGAALVLPDGCMDLLWLGERLVVAGPDTRGYRVAAPAGAAVRGIRFAPGTAPALLGAPPGELLDSRVALSELWPADRVRRAVGLVAAEGDPLRGLAEIGRWLTADAGPVDPVPERIVRSLRGGASVAATADAAGLGARRLHRLSLAAFGYGPKTLARVLRLQRVLALADRGIPFAECAFRAGYADQPHLAREVRALTGRPLRELLGQDSGA